MMTGGPLIRMTGSLKKKKKLKKKRRKKGGCSVIRACSLIRSNTVTIGLQKYILSLTYEPCSGSSVGIPQTKAIWAALMVSLMTYFKRIIIIYVSFYIIQLLFI